MTGRESPFDVRRRAADLRQQGVSYPEISRRIGVSTTTVYRWLNPEYAARTRRSSNDAKRRRHGVCERCGGKTNYNGHGRAMSRFCRTCGIEAAREMKEELRGTGPNAQKIIAFLANGPRRYMEISRGCEIPKHRLAPTIQRLLRYGLIERSGRGIYERAA